MDKEYDIIVGIDPDCGSEPDENGIPTKGGCGYAIYDTHEGTIDIHTLPMHKIFIDAMVCHTMFKDIKVLFVVEASWLTYNPSVNWHGKSSDSRKVAGRKGYDVGRCHEVGRQLVAALRSVRCDVVCRKPLKKMWQGKDGKITHDELSRLIHLDKKRSNQEERDAALLAMHEANHPMRIHTKPL